MSNITADRFAELAAKVYPRHVPKPSGPRIEAGWIEIPSGGWRKLPDGYQPPTARQTAAAKPPGERWAGWK